MSHARTHQPVIHAAHILATQPFCHRIYTHTYAHAPPCLPRAEWCIKLLDQMGPRFAGPIAIVRNWTYCLFYVMAELWGSVVVSVLFWGFANQITTVDEAKQFYPLFGLGANVALIFSGRAVKVGQRGEAWWERRGPAPTPAPTLTPSLLHRSTFPRCAPRCRPASTGGACRSRA